MTVSLASPDPRQVATILKGDDQLANTFRQMRLMKPKLDADGWYKPIFEGRNLFTNYLPSTVLDPLRAIWDRENSRDLVVVDIGSGIGDKVLMLSKDDRVKLAVGIEREPLCVRFSRFMARKYANHPEVLEYLSSWEGLDRISAKYTAHRMGVEWGKGEVVYIPGGSTGYQTHPNKPYLSSDPHSVDLQLLIEVLEWNGQKKSYPPTPAEKKKMLFTLTDGVNYPMPENSVDAVVCVDSAHWQVEDYRREEKLRPSRDHMMESILRMAKPGALLHVHSRSYTIASKSGLAQKHLVRIAEEQGVELEDLGKTFKEAAAGFRGMGSHYYAKLFRVIDK